MYVIILPASMCVHHVGAWCSHRPKEGLVPLELELTGGCNPQGAGNQPGSLARAAARAPNCWASSTAFLSVFKNKQKNNKKQDLH